MAEAAALWAAAEIPTPEWRPGNLQAKYLEPPFSVLDTRSGRWQDRRRAWLALGLQSELGRGGQLVSGGRLAVAEEAAGMGDGGTSLFDPVLCELAYRWWCPEGGAVLDPFAGGSVRGIVAAKLGHPYTGIDLSAEQLAANRVQAEEILGPGDPPPSWLHGDSAQLDGLLPAGAEYDLVLSCPPYHDLEVYSDHPADLSTMEWPAYLMAYDRIIELACRRLRPGRFAVFVVSEIRGPTGDYRGLVPYTVHAFERAGLRYYNEAVLVNAAGSLPLRVGRYMEASRKLGRAHQNVLCFLKGDAPRGWSYEREAPPSPQLGLGLAALGPPAAPAPAVAPDSADGVLGGSPAVVGGQTTCEDHEPGYHATQREADECSSETYGEPSDPEGLSFDVLADGRMADTATGEILTAAGEPYEPPELVTTLPAQMSAAALDAGATAEALVLGSWGLLPPGPEWWCSGCGSVPTMELRGTADPTKARGECTTCHRDKLYQRREEGTP